jgi:hypothetical protein
MSFNTSALTAYVDENKLPIIKEAILKGRTAQLIEVQGGIKYSATINRISNTLIAQAGGCGWSATGSTVLDQRTISVCDIKINEALCLNDLEDFYTSVHMNPGSYNESIPAEVHFAETKKDAIQGLVEDLIWRGDVSGGSGNLALCDGFVDLFDNGITASSAYYGTFSTTDSGSTLIAKIDEMIGKLNTNIIDAPDLTIFMNYAWYRKYAKALRDANYFHYTGAENQGENFSQIHPGTNVRVVGVRGLNTVNRWCLCPAKDLVLGTDLLNDSEDFSIFYSKDNDEVRMLAKWKQGVQVKWLDHVVWYVGS